jgi:hypothetical protein
MLAAHLGRLVEGVRDTPQEDVEHHACHAPTCGVACDEPNDLFVCRVTGRVHVCDREHSTCTDPIMGYNPETGEGIATCRFSGRTWEHYEHDVFTDLYRAEAPSERAHPYRGKEKRFGTVTFEGVHTNLSDLARQFDPLRAHATDEDGAPPVGEGPRTADVDTRTRMLDQIRLGRARTNAEVMERLLDQLTHRNRDADEWMDERYREETAVIRRRIEDRVRDFVDVTLSAGFEPIMNDLVLLLVTEGNDLMADDRRRRSLTERDLDIMRRALRRRCELLWPSYEKRRSECLNQRRRDAGKQGVARDLHLSPTTVNYAFHVLTVTYRSQVGVRKRRAGGKLQSILPAIPDLDLVLPPEGKAYSLSLPADRFVISRPFTKVQSVLESWLVTSIERGEVTSPIVCQPVKTLDELEALLNAE